jgi:hypothetical protein
MSVTLKNVTTAQFANESDEVGISLNTIAVRYFPEYKEKFKNYLNQTTGFAVPDKLSREITIEGKVTGSTGRMAATHTTAQTIVNDTAVIGTSGGGIYMDESTESQKSDGWRSLDQKLSSDPECA